MLSPLFRETAFEDLPGWDKDRHDRAFEAFRRSAIHAASKPYRSGSLGIASASFGGAYAEALTCGDLGEAEAREFFERQFVPCRLAPDRSTEGFVTGFYEPIVHASAVRTASFRFPLLARPPELVAVDDATRPPGLDAYLAYARATPAGYVEIFDRQQIEQGALDGRGLEIAFVSDPVDAFFIHVQGAARLAMMDGTFRRITYAAKSGQRFTGPGGVLADVGEIPREQVTMQSIRAWFRAHPERVAEILWQNRSYIFFREAEVDDPDLGPIAAAKVPLTPGRSIAVDRALHTFGTPFYIDAPSLTAFGDGPFRRLMIAQDTGSAIVGPARGDLFAGSGDAAGEIAGVVRNAADFYILVPSSLVGSPS